MRSEPKHLSNIRYGADGTKSALQLAISEVLPRKLLHATSQMTIGATIELSLA